MITLLSLLISGEVRVSRAVAINNTSTNKIYQQLTNLKNWKNWHPMFKPGIAVITFGSVSSGKNASCDILYKNKTTHLVITAVDSFSVKFILQSPGENNIDNQVSFTALTAARNITVEWRALTKLHWYPWEKFYAIFLDRITGPGYEDALNGLKTYVETSPDQ